MFSFSVMKPSFCFANVSLITIPATSSILFTQKSVLICKLVVVFLFTETKIVFSISKKRRYSPIKIFMGLVHSNTGHI